MRAWALLLGGLVIWAGHFFLLYAIASLLPGQSIARWLAVAATVPALAGAAWLLWYSLGRRTGPGADQMERWIAGVAALGSGTAIVAIAYQGLSALIA